MYYFNIDILSKKFKVVKFLFLLNKIKIIKIKINIS